MYNSIYKINLEVTDNYHKGEVIHEGCNYDKAIKVFEQKKSELLSQGWECYDDESKSGAVDGYDWTRMALFEKGDDFYTLRINNYDYITDYRCDKPNHVLRYNDTECKYITMEEANKLIAA